MFIFLIKDIRERKNITISQLARDTGLSQSYLTELENNKKKNPTLECVHKIAQILKVEDKEIYIATSDIETVRKWMHKSIDENGFDHPETHKYSHMLDKLLNLLQEEKMNKSNLSNKK